MNKFCYMPWHGLTIAANGNVKPCCQWRGSLGVVNGANLAELYNSDSIKLLRQQFLNNELPKSCGSCWEREDMIGASRRTWFNDKFVTNKDSVDELTTIIDKIKWYQVDVNLSNVCNLKCRMCGSWASNQWFEEDRILANIDTRYKKSTDIPDIIQHTTDQLQSIIDNLAYIKRIDFKGGEPMLAKNHVSFLEKIINAGYGSTISLQYTTNGTIVNPKILEILSKFKTVRLIISIEASDSRYSYIRGGKYSINDIENTISEYAKLPNTSIGFNVTIQAYNLSNLKNLYLYLISLENKYNAVSAKSAFTTICNNPMYLSPFVLPKTLRLAAMQDLSNISDFQHLIGSLTDDTLHLLHWDTFVSFTNDVDRLRNENILTVMPELTEYWYETNSRNRG